MKKLSLCIFLVLMWFNVGFAEESELNVEIEKATQETSILRITEGYKLNCEAEIEDFAFTFNQKVVKSKTLISEAIVEIEGDQVYFKINSKINSNGKLSNSKVKVHYSPDIDKDAKHFIKPYIGLLKEMTKEGFVDWSIYGKTLLPIQIEDKKKSKKMFSLMKKFFANDSEMKNLLKKLKVKMYDHYLGTAKIQSEKFYVLKHYMTIEHPDESFLDEMGGEMSKITYTIIHIASGYGVQLQEDVPSICTIYKNDTELVKFDTSELIY